MMNRLTSLTTLTAMILGIVLSPTRADDWPAYQHDNHRSGVTPARLSFPLTQAWVYQSPAPPATAWPGPAPWDSYAGKIGLTPMRNFDVAFFVTSVGEDVYFGSSVDDAVHCLDAATGQEKWASFTDGPVRLPPSYHDGKLYFGSDDGHAYCISAADGSLIWRQRAAPDDRLIPRNGKLTSAWPVMTGVLVHDGRAYFGGSLIPWEETYLCAVDAETGSFDPPGCYRVTQTGMTLQGALLASDVTLYLPQGRLPPARFDRQTGKFAGTIGDQRQGGVYALLTSDSSLIYGRGVYRGGVTENKETGDSNTSGASGASGGGDTMISYQGGNCMVVTRNRSFLMTDEEISALDRDTYGRLSVQRQKLEARRNELAKEFKDAKDKGQEAKVQTLQRDLEDLARALDANAERLKQCFLWKVPTDLRHSMILAGDTLIAGGQGKVAAINLEDGQTLWSAEIEGVAHGLAAANGRLYVSTDRGWIYCFGG